MRARLLLVGEEAGALEHDRDAEVLQRELRRVLLGGDLDVHAADVEARRRPRLARGSARPCTVS